MSKRLATGIAGSRLAVIVTTAIITTIVIAGGIAAATVAINSVGSAEIIDGSIRSSDIANGTIRSGDITDGTVRSGDIADGTVRSGDITDGTIRSADIANNTIRSADIGTGQVTSGDIADETVTGADIEDQAVGSSEILDGSIGGVDLGAAAQPAGVNFADGDQLLALTAAAQSVRDVVLDAPAAGYVIVTAGGYTLFGSSGFDRAFCTITDGAITVDDAHYIVADDSGINASTQRIPLSGTRTFAVPAGPTTFRLVCQEIFGSVFFVDSQITALYVPTLYAP